MNLKFAILTAACALALAGCGDKSPPSEPAAATPTVPAEAATPAPAPATPTPTADTATPSTDTAATSCETVLDGNDAMQFNLSAITVPKSCTDFTINLKHTGTMPVAAMGHNVVIAKTADMTGVVADGMGAGVAGDYVKAGDARVVARSKLVGGGESTSVTFPVSAISKDGPYSFFCSFPGHSSMMKGTLTVQ